MTKTCNKCLNPLPPEAFSASRAAKDGLQASCRECQSKRWATYKASTGDAIRARQREYHALPDVRARKRKYQTLEKYKDCLRQWVNRNREKVRGYDKAYDAKAAANGGKFGRREWRTLLKLCDYKCLSCGKRERLCADHVVPVSMGGSNDISNRQVLCLSCNSIKADKHIDYRSFAP